MTTNDPVLGSAAPDPPLLPTAPPGPHDPYTAMRNKNFRRYFTGNAFALVGQQMASITISWELYARTNSATALGLVGLVQIIPILMLSLLAGHLVDRFNRKKLILLGSASLALLYTLMGFSSRFAGHLHSLPAINAVNSALQHTALFLGDPHPRFSDPQIPILFLLLLLIGAVRSVNQPARQTIMPMLVTPRQFSNAVAWNSSLFETSSMIGPTIAGFAIAALHGTTAHDTWAYAAIYWTNAVFQMIQFLNIARIQITHAPRPPEPVTLRSLLAGVHFVAASKIILAVITLDLFAVLLGGATALLPLYAKDILHVGPQGLGWLRAAPSVGALSMAMLLAHLPPMKNAGRNLLFAVLGFGLATIVFAFSTNLWLSLAALVFTGVFDNISVVVRHTLVQLLTPDSMRGRVNAVNSVFISCSNELGALESGTTAAVGIRFLGPILGPMTAVAAGGAGTLAVVAIVAAAWPQIKFVRQLSDLHPKP